MLNKNTAVTTIQQIGKRPYKTPFAVDKKASFTGIPYITTAITIAIAVASKLAVYPFIFLMISAQKIKRTGIIATRADKPI